MTSSVSVAVQVTKGEPSPAFNTGKQLTHQGASWESQRKKEASKLERRPHLWRERSLRESGLDKTKRELHQHAKNSSPWRRYTVWEK